MRIKRTDLYFGLFSSLTIVGLFIFPFVANFLVQFMPQQSTPQNQGIIAPLFTEQVQYWEQDIAEWSATYNIDPNLMATIMQIESCGHPTVVSNAGANGLFQVMPFHFATGEDMVDPDTNAFRSANFINECYNWADGDVGMILGCYNGGPSVINRDFGSWYEETQRYYVWGLGIYRDAITYSETSTTLDTWLNAGGQYLCDRASVVLQIP